MKTDNSTASFWHSYRADETATKRLTGKTESLAPTPVADAVNADENRDRVMLEAGEYHP